MSTEPARSLATQRKTLLMELSQSTDVFGADEHVPCSITEEVEDSTGNLSVHSEVTDEGDALVTSPALISSQAPELDSWDRGTPLRRSATTKIASAGKSVRDAISSKASATYSRAYSFGARRNSNKASNFDLPSDVLDQNNKSGQLTKSRTMSSSSQSEEFSLAIINDLDRALKVHAQKLTKNTLKEKIFFLDSKRRIVFWRPTQKYGNIDLLNLREIRYGLEAVAMNDRLKVPAGKEDLLISVSFLPNHNHKDTSQYMRYRTTNILFPTKAEFETWKYTLKELMQKSYDPYSTIKRLVRQQCPGSLSFENLVRITHECRLRAPKHLLQQAIRHSAQGAVLDENISSEHLDRYLLNLQERPELRQLFDELRSSELGVSLEDWAHSVDESHRSLLMSDKHLFDGKTILDFPSFKNFMVKIGNNSYSEADDMSHPLSAYYASSSHNTYLVASQITGDSTVDGYIRALLKGCRTIEIDIHNGDPFPVVHHRRSMTTSISLEHVCKAIKRYAFESSVWPVIISAEIHCNDQQQGCIAEIMRRIFGDSLLSRPLYDVDNDEGELNHLPRLEDLRHKILLKGKNRSLETDDGYTSSDLHSPYSVDLSSTDLITHSDMDLLYESMSYSNISSQNSLPLAIQTTSIQNSSNPSTEPPTPSRRISFSSSNMGVRNDASPNQSMSNKLNSAIVLEQHPSRTKKSFGYDINPELASLYVYTVGVKCKGFEKSKHYGLQQVVSLSEGAGDRYISTSFKEIAEHNATHISRCYPAANRLFSSNPDPIHFWTAGCQWVALNWQTNDLAMSINTAMFRRNQGTGYCLKPEYLRSVTKYETRRIVRNRLRIKIVSAHNLPVHPDTLAVLNPSVKKMSPFVSVRLHGVSPVSEGSMESRLRADGGGHVFRTRTVNNNTLNPHWNEECLFEFVTMAGGQDLVFLRFSVGGCDSEDHFSSGFTISLGSMRQGWQQLGLEDLSGNLCVESYLFVFLELLTY